MARRWSRRPRRGTCSFGSSTSATAPERCAAPDASHFVVTHSGLDRPPAPDLLGADGTVGRRLSTADVTGLAPLDVPTAEPFTCVAADGATELHGVMYKPAGFDPTKTYPVIEDIYGDPRVPHEHRHHHHHPH